MCPPDHGLCLSDAASDVKESVVDNISEKLNCFGIPRTRRMDSNGNNLVATSQQYVIAVSLSYSDQPEIEVPCSIPVELEVPTACSSMDSSLTIYVSESTSSATLAEIK